MIIFHIIPLKSGRCEPSLEPSRRDGSNEGSQHMFSLRNLIILSLNYPQNFILSGPLLYIKMAGFTCLGSSCSKGTLLPVRVDLL